MTPIRNEEIKRKAWKVTEGKWNNTYVWFLVDNGEIQFAFKSEAEAQLYLNQSHIDYMLLTNLSRLAHETMLDATKYRSWCNKVQTCLEILPDENGGY